MEQIDGTDLPGNTYARQVPKSRGWMITIYDDELVHFDKAIYECWCDDTCKDGKHHIHQLVYFKNPVSFNTIKKRYATSHIEAAHNVFDCIKYISATDKRKYNFNEIGTRPVDARYKSTRELLDCNDVSEIPWQQINTWNKLNKRKRLEDRMLRLREQILSGELDDVHCTYVVGEPGSGKTHAAYWLAAHNHEPTDDHPIPFGVIIFNNDFVDCQIPDATAQVIEEFRSSDIRCSTLLQLIDKYSRLVNCKGGSVIVESNYFYFASYKYPHELYRSDENYKQFLRRFEKIYHVDKQHQLRDITDEYKANPFNFTS